jgi:hypothetical protein
MRTGVLGVYGEPMTEENLRWLSEAQRHCSITASGSEPLILQEPSMPNLISIYISKIESWSLNLSSLGAKRLNTSYWIFTVLSCIAFFTSHWSIFLAFLIPALITNHMRVLRKAWKTASSSSPGPSTNGT